LPLPAGEPQNEIEGGRIEDGVKRTTPLVVVAVVGLLAGDGAWGADDPVADRVFAALQEARAREESVALRRHEVLDAVAGRRAAAIAALPHGRRLAYEVPLADDLRQAGLELRRSASHLDMVRGYEDPAGGFLRAWRRYEQAWETALDPALDRVGLATRRSEDGWVVLVVVFGDEMPQHGDVASLERQTMEAVNEVRRRHGLGELAERADLAAAARGHSEEMARLDYFSHRAPDGTYVDDRIRVRGVRFRRVAENIQRNRGHDDPVAVAVRSWLDSEPHRETILSPGYTEAGVGVAVSEDGTVFLTQVFLEPPARGAAASPGAPGAPGAPGTPGDPSGSR
jgi:hypothetical protein